MSTIGTLFSAFQVNASIGLEPYQCVELSDHNVERKRPSRATRTKLSSRPSTRQHGRPVGAA